MATLTTFEEVPRRCPSAKVSRRTRRSLVQLAHAKPHLRDTAELAHPVVCIRTLLPVRDSPSPKQTAWDRPQTPLQLPGSLPGTAAAPSERPPSARSFPPGRPPRPGRAPPWTPWSCAPRTCVLPQLAPSPRSFLPPRAQSLPTPPRPAPSASSPRQVLAIDMPRATQRVLELQLLLGGSDPTGVFERHPSLLLSDESVTESAAVAVLKIRARQRARWLPHFEPRRSRAPQPRPDCGRPVAQELAPRVPNPERIVRENPDLIWRLGIYSERPRLHALLRRARWQLSQLSSLLPSVCLPPAPLRAETFFSLPVDIQNLLTGPWEDSEEERKAVSSSLAHALPRGAMRPRPSTPRPLGCRRTPRSGAATTKLRGGGAATRCDGAGSAA